MINLARVRMTNNDRRGAEELLLSATNASPANATALFALADLYNITGDPKAVQSYARGLQMDPDHAAALAALARLHAKAGQQQDADTLFARLAKNPDRRFRYSHASYLYESGRKDAAIKEFTRILQGSPEDREVRTHLINAYLATSRTGEAEQLLARAISRNAKDADALLQRARIYLSRGMPDAAQNDLRLVQEHQPDSAEAHYLMAHVHRLSMKVELQQQELTAALRLDPKHLPARLDLSRLLIRKDPKGSLQTIDSAPAEQLNELALRTQRVWPLLELNRLEEARSTISGLIQSGSAEVLLQDAILRMSQKDFAGAQASAKSVLAGNPADVRALELIMRCAAGEKRMADGLAFVRRHAAQNKGIPQVQLLLGRIEMQAGNVSKARAALETAKASDAKSLDVDWSLIEVDIAERKWDDARRRIAPLLKGEGPVRVAAMAKLALIEQTAGNYLAASEHYRKVLQSNPRALLVLNNLAYILTQFLDKPTEALRYAQTAKELAPDNAGVDDTLGWTYYRMGLYPGAIRHLELAVKREPTARRHAYLSMAYAKSGDRKRAVQTLDRALQMDPKLPEASMAQKIVADPGSTMER